MTTISKRLSHIVHQRANRQCEYCQTQKRVVITMNVDHIVPVNAGGPTIESNLCLSCAHCNNHKTDHQAAVDPETDVRVRLFNPRIDAWNDHFQWSEDYSKVVGRTSIGRATISCLKMNASEVIESRTVWVLAGLHPPPSKEDKD